ncbi:hypothetical protein EVAR_71798_1 [Eumeta japonica]|uniref:Uncharacterized protein n=1 Tax=Eumeta variegata TaxID=151549 RepID=A0A4C1TCQ9_EUMVA|nr:hypothetical protein EVAR_71798_1 [Eumeta japonica]
MIFDDYEDEFLDHHDPYIEEIGKFEEIPPELEQHDDNLPQHCPEVPKCAEGYVAVEIYEGHAVPGKCCSIFRCIKSSSVNWVKAIMVDRQV